MRPSFLIRPATIDDFSAMTPLWRQLDDYHHMKDPEAFPRIEAALPRSRAYIEDIIRRADYSLLVAEDVSDEAQLLGLCLVQIKTLPPNAVLPARVIFEIENLVVDEMARRRGIARALCSKAEQWSRQNGASEMLLTVLDFNHAARAFYQQIGFLPKSHCMRRELG